MNHLNWVLAYWTTVMTGETNYIKQKQADVSMIADFEIEQIEIAWLMKTLSCVQIATIISKIWQSVNEFSWDSDERERRESMFKENSVICERLIWDDETMFERVQKLIDWQVAQFQTTIVLLATIQCVSDVDELDDDDDIVLDVLEIMQQQILDENDETDELDIVVMWAVVEKFHSENFRDDVDVSQIDSTDEDDEIELQILLDDVIYIQTDLDDDEVDDDDIWLETDETDEMRDMNTNDTLIEFDEVDEMLEYSDVDETDELEVIRATDVHILETTDDEIDETDECDETDEALDVSDVLQLEIDETDENELFVDELDDEQHIQLEQLETDETQSIICIDWFFTLVNISTTALKHNDEDDETDEVDDDTNLHKTRENDETDDVDETDEKFLLLMWNCFNFELWMFQLEADDVNELDIFQIDVLEQIEQLDDTNLVNLFSW